MMDTLQNIRQAFQQLSDPARAKHSQKFFRTGPGEYGEGDRFLGITVPLTRKMAKQCKSLTHQEIYELLQSPYHEERLLALLVLVERFKKCDPPQQKPIFNSYVKHKKFINNWDLVDSSAAYIVGAYLMDKDKSLLYKWAKSKNLWDRRIAIMATFQFIKHRQFNDTLAIATILLHDSQDLIHKAVGWMLREIGNRDLAVEEAFLQQHYRQMPRTMLRYAIEKLTEKRRQQYLKGLA